MDFYVDMRNSDRKDMIEGCITLFMRELKLTRRKGQLFVSLVKGFEKEKGCSGMVYPHSDGIVLMDLDSRLSMNRLVEVLAHEMVHVKQIVKKELVQKGKKIYWKNQLVNAKKTSYYNHPWEIDAWKNEKVLASRVWFKLEEAGIIEKVGHGLS